MKRILIFFIVLSGMASCYRTAPDPEFNMALVLPADTLAVIIADLHLADAFVDNIKDKKFDKGHLSSEYFNAVMEMHNLQAESFEESMRYYSYRTEELNEIYEKVIILLSKKESLLLPLKEADKTTP